MLVFVAVAPIILEFAFDLRVLRSPRRLLSALGLVIPPFVLWDYYAIVAGHWFFDRNQVLGLFGPLGIPLEEYLFFVIIPIAAVSTLEGVESLLRRIRYQRGASKL